MTAPVSHSVDPRLDRHRRALLERAARQTKNPELAELAREIKAGNITTLEVARTDIYSQALAGGAKTTVAWYRDTTPEEREELAAEANDHLNRLDELDAAELARLDQQQPSPPPSRRRPQQRVEEADYDEVDFLAEEPPNDFD